MAKKAMAKTVPPSRWSGEVRSELVVSPATRRRFVAPSWRLLLLTAGPGLVAMLADTDAGSVVTAAQSGAQWGYRLLALQFILIPFMFLAQELALRLGLLTGRGATELVAEHFGRAASLVLAGAIIISCIGALVTELSGLAGAAGVYGVPVPATVAVAVIGLIVMVITGSYRSVERVALFFGLFELGFVVVAWRSHPNPQQMLAHFSAVPLRNHEFLYLIAANLGTSLMPWTLAYQQSACVDKGLGHKHLLAARVETAVGVMVCQIITAAILIAAAAKLGGRPLVDIGDIASAFTQTLGVGLGRLIFVAALSGSALVAAIVLSLATAWTIGEALGLHHSLEHSLGQAPWFYGGFSVLLIAGGVLVASGIDLVRLSIAAGVVNALLLPIMLFFLYRLARLILPAAVRLRGWAAVATAVAFIFISALGLVTGLSGIAS